jgi:hypothetical protein
MEHPLSTVKLQDIIQHKLRIKREEITPTVCYQLVKESFNSAASVLCLRDEGTVKLFQISFTCLTFALLMLVVYLLRRVGMKKKIMREPRQGCIYVETYCILSIYQLNLVMF